MQESTATAFAKTPTAAGGGVSKDVQLTALLASVGVLAGATVYLWGEIQSVLELLEMAYG